jgi:LacI family transcriptional regulator
VVLDRHISGARVDTVRCDSEGGAYQLIKHLIDLGHKRIVVISGPASISTSVDRVQGYFRAFKEAGLEVDEKLVHYGGFNQTSGYELTNQILATQPVPTAIFASNNFIALGAYRALLDAGLRIPEDVSLVAFDDLPALLVLEPFFTVASQPALEMGQKGTELLLARLAGGGPEGPQEIVLPTTLIIRRSSAVPRTNDILLPLKDFHPENKK